MAFIILLDSHINKEINLESPILITIKQGESLNRFSSDIVSKGWLDNRFWLRAYARINTKFSALKAGTYQVSPKMTVLELLTLITSGKEHQFSITFIEGTTLAQWLELLAEHENIVHSLPELPLSELSAHIAKELNILAQNPEGWFFPDTYAFTAGTKDITLLKRAHSKMKSQLAQLWLQRAEPLPYRSAYEALIMASIVEKESAQQSEKPLIASVFVNRLNKKMRLQTDPTVIYGLGTRYQGNITRKHLREKTAYNTYRIDRLPPTPIAMPGLAALEAVVKPDTSNYLYFVSQGDGHHVFSTNLADHNRAVARYQLGKNK